MIKRIVDAIMEFLAGLVEVAIGWLPESPFVDLPEFSQFRQIMSWINYFVPVGTMLSIFTVYLAAVAVWYAVRWILRIARYID